MLHRHQEAHPVWIPQHRHQRERSWRPPKREPTKFEHDFRFVSPRVDVDVQEFFQSNEPCDWERPSSLFVSASCCGVGMENPNIPETGGPAGAGGAGSGVAVIPDRPPLELDKLPPYHDVAPSPGECYYVIRLPSETLLMHMRTRRPEITEKWPLVTRVFSTRYVVCCDRGSAASLAPGWYVSFRSAQKIELAKPDLTTCFSTKFSTSR